MKKIAGNECALLCQQLSMMISSGLSAEDGLGVVANDQPDAGLHDALLKIKNEMELGETLADSLERTEAPAPSGEQPSRLRQWPVQIQLVPVRAPYFADCDLLVAADCTAYACGAFHERLLKGKILLVGCPKLDPVDYAEKLEAIFRQNDLRSVTVARMEVPCCGGLEHAVRTALERSGKPLPLEVITISADGRIL